MALDTVRSDLAHLHRRLGFGATAAELDAAESAGYDATLARLLRPPAGDPGVAATPAPTLAPVVLGAAPGTPERKAEGKALRSQAVELLDWWLDRMVAVRDPFPEKLTLFWHGHFATSIAKVRQATWMLRQNEILRSRGQGDVHELTLAVAQDPAMLIWLDATKDTAANPNENLARELMELFTLGVGSYTEDDVRQGARCFTGWGYQRTSGAFLQRPRNHDNGTKTFLGTTGNLDGTDVVRLATTRPESARFVTFRLWNRFVAPVPITDPDVARLTPAAPVAVAPLLARMFADPSFRAARSSLVAQPVEYVVGALRQLGLRPADVTTVKTLGALGQIPFDPPTVGGWPAGSGWLTTSAAMARLDVAQQLAAKADLAGVADVPASQRLAAVTRLLSLADGLSAQTTAALTATGGDPAQMVALALCSPEYVTR